MRALTSSLSFLLFCDWAITVVGFRLGMELFADFKITMPALTFLSISVTSTLWLWPVTIFVAASSIFLAPRTRLGWWLGLAVCLLCDVLVLSYVLPIVALTNGLSGGVDFALFPIALLFFLIAPAFPMSLWPIIILASFGLTQFIFAALIFRRRDFIK